MTPKDHTLSQRVQRLERQNRRLLLVAGGAILAMLLGANAGPDVVRGTKFELLDASGTVRAELSADEEAVGLFIRDETGTTRIGIAQFAHGGGGVALHGPGSKSAAVLYLKDEGSLRFFDAEGAVTNQVLANKPLDR